MDVVCSDGSSTGRGRKRGRKELSKRRIAEGRERKYDYSAVYGGDYSRHREPWM
jgi:hypothetical protein